MTLYCNIIKNAEQEIKCVSHYEQIYDDRLRDFLKENAPAYEDDIERLVEDIKEVKVSNTKSKIPKFTMQVYYYFYDMLTDFPPCKFKDLKTVTTKSFLINFYKVLNAKVHIHHSHVTGEIFGYAHDFCNWKVRENKTVVPLIGHNFLGFDIFYMVKGFRSSVWGTNDLNMGGTNLTNVNFASVGEQVKIIDTLKYYQTSLSALTSTADEKGKAEIRKSVLKFLNEHEYFNQIWSAVEKSDEDKILNIIESGKGVMPYEKIRNIESLDSVPQNEFFDHTEFYSSLKQANVSKEEYENCKFLYQKLKMRNLGDLNDLYNMQDIILLCELIENRFQLMHEKFGFNPRKINSASALSGCVQRDQSKVLIALPTCYEHAEVFEKSLIGGFSCVNTRIGFNSEVMLPSYTKQEYAKMNIEQSFKAYKNQNFKIGYKLKMPWDKFYKDYRIISKIIKFDENNQYGHAMTKPMPVGSIKEKEADWLKFNLLLEKVDLDDEIGHLFLVDIEFHQHKATPRQMLYNEIFLPIVEKKKTLDANERSVFQLFELYSETEKHNPKSYKLSSQSQATLMPKKYIPLYLEELKFLIFRCGWKVTKLYRHYYFEQKRFKKDFILMNQTARQDVKNLIESNFCKLLNNANFGYDCKNNLDNCTFEPIRDEIGEIRYIRKYNNVFDKEVTEFVNPQILKEELSLKYNNKVKKLSADDPYCSGKMRAIENSKAADEEAIKSFEKKLTKSHKRKTFKNYDDRINDAMLNDKVKTVLDFSFQDTGSVKALGVKKNEKIKITTRFIKGKMLMFSKISLKAFVYDIIDIFSFLDLQVQEIFAQKEIIKCYVYLILTDTDSCSLQFLFLSNLNCRISEDEARDLIFDILIMKLGQRLDTSHEFFERFKCRNKATKKKVGLYEVESIDNQNMITLAINPKEYYEVFKSKEINKKHKGVKKATPGMDFESFASRIMDFREFQPHEKKPKAIKQKRFQIKYTQMRMTETNRSQFGLLNCKRYYLTDGVCSLPFGHFLFGAIREKNKQIKNIHRKLMEIKDDLLREEFRATAKCERISLLRSILAQPPTYYKLDSTKRASIKNIFGNTRDYILGGDWR